VPLHRKRTDRSKVAVAALGVALTVSGVAYAAQARHESPTSAATPTRTTDAPASPSSSTGTDPLERDVQPSRSITTRSALPNRTGSVASKRQPRPSPSRDRRPGHGTVVPTAPAAPVPSTTAAARHTTATPAPTSTPTPAPTRKPTRKVPTAGSAILTGTNAARSDSGLPSLSRSSCLARLAQRHAVRLAAAGTLYHQDLGTVMSTCGMSTAGENVAMNYSRPSDMVQQWLSSPGHRANLLSSRFSLIGIGVARARDGAWYGVQVFGSR
jgi:uncharacterized protein YkwD